MMIASGALIILALYMLVPFVVLALVARNRRRSQAFTLWGFLSWLGMIIGLVILLVTPAGGFANKAG